MATEHAPEVLIAIPEVQLYQYQGQEQVLVEQAPLALLMVGSGNDSALYAEVGKINWKLDVATPVLQHDKHTYVFSLPVPDGKLFYSVLLRQDTDVQLVELFEEVLQSITSMDIPGALSKTQKDIVIEEVAEDLIDSTADLPYDPVRPVEEALPAPPPTRAPMSMQERILHGAERLKGSIASAGIWASTHVTKGGEYIQARTKPSEPIQVSEKTLKRMKTARVVAARSASVANTVAIGAADATVWVGSSITKALKGKGKDKQLVENPSTRADAAGSIAAAAVISAIEVYESMEDAARLLFTTSSKSASDVVTHKYGPNAGQVVRDGTMAATDVVLTTVSVRRIGMKRIAKRIAKQTAKGLVKQYYHQAKNDMQGVPNSVAGPGSEAEQGIQGQQALHGANGAQAAGPSFSHRQQSAAHA